MSGIAYDRLKRVIDISLSAVGLVVTAPVQLVVALLVRFKLGTPVLFRQRRPGKDGRIFELVKFRTMLVGHTDADPQGDSARLTPFGSRLRSLSLDELPTLWNVLRGDMSLVGPRPLLVRYLDRYDADQGRRHEVRPGITGLAQVNGRNALTWEEKFGWDVQYVERRSLALDVRILWATLGHVLRRTGISDDAGPTMTEFMGSSNSRGNRGHGADR